LEGDEGAANRALGEIVGVNLISSGLASIGPIFRFRPGEGDDLLFREGSMPHGRDALAARFTRA
jgi:hypothetical protein